MRNELDYFSRIKQGLHCIQALFIFIGWSLTVAVLTKSGGLGGGTWFYFVLCFMTVPALIYQVMVPIFPRAQRFANLYAYAAIDTVFAILWLSTSVAVAIWNAAGIAQAEDYSKDGDGTCKTFAYGDSTKCSVSKASVGFGVMIFILFAGTTAISVRASIQYRITGPQTALRTKLPTHFNDPSKDVWSASLEERDRSSDDETEMDERHRYGQIPADDAEAALHDLPPYSQIQVIDPHPGAPLRFETSSNSLHTAQRYDSYVPSALSPVSRDQDDSHQLSMARTMNQQYTRAEYPSARYDRL